MRKSIPTLKILTFLFLFFGFTSIHQKVCSQVTNSGFETGALSPWTGSSKAVVSSGFTVLSWTVNPSGSYMGSMDPTPNYMKSSAETDLGLSSGSLAAFNPVFEDAGNMKATNFGVLTQDIALSAGQTFTLYWNYVSRDYTPFNDGAIATLVGPSYKNIQLLAVTADPLGNAGAKVTGSYGSTGWHAVTFTAGAAGVYKLGFACYNAGDQAYDPILVVDHAPGGTSAPNQPIVMTSPVSSTGCTSVTTGGNVTSDGGSAVTARGVAWGTSSLPTVAGNHTTDGTGTGTFTSTILGLTPGTMYYVRSYATNIAGTVYGSEVSFVAGAATPTITASGSTTFCHGGSVTLTASEGSSYLWSNGASTQSIAVTQSGSYTVTVTNGSCSATSTPTTVTVNALPTGEISGSTAICTGGTANLTLDVAGSGTMSGSLSNGQTFSGTAPTINVAVNPSATTTYTIAALSDGNCSAIATGLTGSATVNVNSTPELTTTNYTANAGINCTASVSFAATATGSPAPSITYSIGGTAITSPYTFYEEVTTVTATAINSCGTDTKTFTVTVSDVAPPVFTKIVTRVAVIGGNSNSNIVSYLNSNGFTATNFNTTIPSTSILNTYDAVILLRMAGNSTLSTWVNNGGMLITEWSSADWAANTAHLISASASFVGFVGTGTPITFASSPLGVKLGAGLPNPYSNGGATEFFYFFNLGPGVQNLATRPTNIPAIISGRSGTGYTFLIGYDWADGFPATSNASGTLIKNILNSGVLSGIPADIAVNNDANKCSATVVTPNAVPSDNCSIAKLTWEISGSTVASSPTTGINNIGTAIFNVGTSTVTYTATDGSNNSVSGSFTVTVTDNQKPVIITNGNKSVNNDVNTCGAAVTVSATATDNCSVGAPTGVRSDGLALNEMYPIGTTTITWNVTDVNGNAALPVTETVTVTDNQLPVITCPADIHTFATSAAGAVVNFTAPIGTDNCTGVTTAKISALGNGSTFPIGTTPVTYKVTDASGNTAQCSFNVVVTGIAPVITCPANITVNAENGACSAAVTFAATETTAIPASTITYSIQPGSRFNVGTTTVTATAVNAVGQSQCSFTVTVTDNQKPVITTNGNKSVVNAANACGATVSLSATATDNCGVGTPTGLRSDTLALNAPYPIGTTTITWNVTDVNGVAALPVTQTVTVNDNQKPTITAPPAVTATTNVGCTATLAGSGSASTTDTTKVASSGGVVLGTPTTSDNCSVASVTNNAPSAFPLGNTTVIWTVRDGSGNTATATQVVTVIDNVKPTITAPAAVTVNTNSGCTAINVALGTPGTFDNCSVKSVTNNAPAVFPLGNTTITWTVTDGSGNTATATQVVTVKDVTPPVITLVGSGASPDVLENPNHKMVDVAVKYTSSDNCSSTCEITNIKSSEAINGLGDGDMAPDWELVDNANVRLRAERSGKGDGRTYTITIACTDPSGNKSTKDVTVFVPKNRSSIASAARGAAPQIAIVGEPVIKVFPNPSNGQFRVQLNNFKATKAELSVMTIAGAVVAKKAVQTQGDGQIISFDLSNHPAGMYIVKVVSEDGVQTARVQIQR